MVRLIRFGRTNQIYVEQFQILDFSLNYQGKDTKNYFCR